MTKFDFPIKNAAQVLLDAGLLSGLMVPADQSLVDVETSTTSSLSGSFLGAGLDSRNLKPGELFIALAGENVDGRKFISQVLEKGHWILAAPNDDLIESLLAGKCINPHGGILWSSEPEKALAALGATWRQLLQVKVVGITGTNGKTTTKDLLAAMLSARGLTVCTAGNFNNHLGLPITLLNIRPEHEFAVVEMGASAVGEIAFLAGLAAPEVGIITNASEAHLAEFGSLAGIVQGKGELLERLPKSGLAVLNADSPGFESWQNRASCTVSSFGEKQGQHLWTLESSHDFSSVVKVGQSSFSVPLPGRHNGANLVAAMLAARHLGLSDQEIISGLDGFAGSPHRGVLFTMAGRQILDDCYNANPRSMVAAVTTLLQLAPAKDHVAILGHMAELGDDSAAIHRDTGAKLAAVGLKNLVVVGEEARPLLVGFDEMDTTGHYCSTLEAAAELVSGIAGSGDCILIKGSRSAAMENILPLLQEQLDRK